MCLLCGAGTLYASFKANKALDRAFVKEEPTESYFKTELRHSFAVLGASKTARQDRESYESYGASRKMTKKEQESRARLQALVDAHAPSKKR
jgi:hypothetical protein|mmetsp:Transcript_6906/g.19084  ORF Transcript_6906/g.19084 Transcript_6906/m.19084 type:complete len:92 (+) Transcript_6906:599-874(+)